VKTCETCRFWSMSPKDENGFDVGVHRLCAAVIHGNHWNAEDGTVARSLAVVTDGSGYAAALRTQANFGCVMHEEKQ
jgi:hypothetical protein